MLYQPYPSKYDLYLVRHGEAISNVDVSVYKYGNEDLLGLTVAGIKQAGVAGERLARSLQSRQEDKKVWLHVSNTLRARQTAQIISWHLKEEGVDVHRTEKFGSQEFYSVNSGREPEGWDFQRYMRNPFELDFGIEVLNPYQHFLEVVTSFRTMMEEVHQETLPEERPCVVYVGNHFLLNMLRCYLWSLEMVESNRLRFNLLQLLTFGAAPDSQTFMEPRNNGQRGFEVWSNLSVKSVATAVGSKDSDAIREYVDSARRLLSHALHLPISNAQIIPNKNDPVKQAFMSTPTSHYLGEIPQYEVPWFSADTFLVELESLYLNLLRTHAHHEYVKLVP